VTVSSEFITDNRLIINQSTSNSPNIVCRSLVNPLRASLGNRRSLHQFLNDLFFGLGLPQVGPGGETAVLVTHASHSITEGHCMIRVEVARWQPWKKFFMTAEMVRPRLENGFSEAEKGLCAVGNDALSRPAPDW